jgi:hypothetical protein
MPHRFDYPVNYDNISKHINVYGKYDSVIPNAGGSDGSAANPGRCAEAFFEPLVSEKSKVTSGPIDYVSEPGTRFSFGQGLAGHSNIISHSVWDRYIAEYLEDLN